MQAEHLPLNQMRDYKGNQYLLVYFSDVSEGKKSVFTAKGFAVSEAFPATVFSDRLEVDFRIEKSDFWAQHGYALPSSLQYFWNDNAFVVTRSIISEGFWCAYKWWADCKWWYAEKHPEWFIDDKMYGATSPPEHQYAAVLGNKDRTFWESRKYF